MRGQILFDERRVGFGELGVLRDLSQRHAPEDRRRDISGLYQCCAQFAGSDIATFRAWPIRGLARTGSKRQRAVDTADDVGEADF